MSMTTEEMCEKIDTKLHEVAVEKFARVLANCESDNWNVAQQAHEDVQEMRLSMSSGDFDRFLLEATIYMERRGLRPERWMP